MKVEELTIDKPDASGAVTVITIYERHTPKFAVYRTQDRVMVHYADDPVEWDRQACALAALNCLRGEINSLIDGWRTSSDHKVIARVKKFDRGVADALIVAVRGDVPTAARMLEAVKQEILDERTSWARFQYLIVASLSAAVLTVIVVLGVLLLEWARQGSGRLMWLGVGAGTVGAFFSVAIGIRSRTVLPDTHFRDNAADAVLRVVIGCIAAIVAVILVQLKAINMTLGDAAAGLLPATPSPETQLMFYLLVAFIAGFSERMIPDLLARATADPMQAVRAQAAQAAVAVAQQRAAGQQDNQPQPPVTQAQTAQVPQPVVVGDSPGPDCLCDFEIKDHEHTADADLPAARGGVALAA